MRNKLVAGNWKMHGTREIVTQLITSLARNINPISNLECAVFPPFVYLAEVLEHLCKTSIEVGAQNVSEFNEGAYTGEIAAPMLRDIGCRYVLVGHSERRTLFKETDQQIANKYEMALNQGIIPILCVGETLKQREQNETEAVISRQLHYFLTAEKIASLAEGVIAYEPVWAIGTGQTATPEHAQMVHAFIRKEIAKRDQNIANKLRILYGGSVKSANAKALFAMPDIDGGLIGGASLNAVEFLQIYQAAG